MKDIILEMEAYAEKENVPIIERDSIRFINSIIREIDAKTVLEVGSAIGYSAILMALSKENLKIVTIEKDEKRYIECLNNIKKCNLEKQIDVVFQDALEINLAGFKYDVIFIDAAKGQYEKYFEKFQYYLNDGGCIITDNMNFHGLVGHKEKAQTDNVRKLVEKIENYIAYLKNKDDFHTEFFDIGDGLAVSKRKNSNDR